MKNVKTLLMPIMAISFLASCGGGGKQPDPPTPPVPEVYDGGINLTYMRFNVGPGAGVKFNYKCTLESGDDLKVYWDDGTVDNSNSHTYSKAGKYHVYITGHIDEIALCDDDGNKLASENHHVTNIVFSNYVTKINKNSFKIGVNSTLQSVLIPKTVESIGSSAFNTKNDIKYYCFEDKRSNGWDANCFEGVDSKDVIPGLILYMKDDNILYAAYKDNENRFATVYVCCDLKLKNAVIKDSITINDDTYTVTSIWESAFYDMDTLESVEIPGSVKDIGKYSFVNCVNLKNVKLNEGIEKIRTSAFQNTGISEITIPGTIKDDEGVDDPKFEQHGLNWYSFGNCRNLKKVVFTNSPDDSHKKEITNYSFQKSYNINEMILGEGITQLESYAIEELSITEVALPSSIKGIDSYGIRNCYSLTTIDASKFTTSNIPTLTDHSLLFANPDNIINIKIASGLTKENFTSKGWPEQEVPTPSSTGFTYTPIQ